MNLAIGSYYHREAATAFRRLTILGDDASAGDYHGKSVRLTIALVRNKRRLKTTGNMRKKEYDIIEKIHVQ